MPLSINKRSMPSISGVWEIRARSVGGSYRISLNRKGYSQVICHSHFKVADVGVQSIRSIVKGII